MRYFLLCAASSLLFPACATAPLPKGATARVAVFPPSASLSRARRDDVAALRTMAAQLVDSSPRLEAVKVKATRRKLKRRLRRATRRCKSKRCRADAMQRVVGARLALKLKISRRGRRCRVAARLQRFGYPKAKVNARRTAACTDGALAGSAAGAICEVLEKTHAATRAKCLVRGELFWLDRMAHALLGGRLKLQRNKVAERILGLKGAYLQIARRAEPRVGVIAHCRAAWLYDQLAHHMTPKGEKATGDAAAFRRQAATLYRGCIAQAQKSGVPAPAAAEKRLGQIATP